MPTAKVRVSRFVGESPLILWACLWFAALAAISGCSQSGISGLYPVTGKVTHNGAPVAGATISFVGQGDSKPATAISRADGSYELFTLDSPGAFPGSYTVVVSKTDAPPPTANADPGMDPTGRDLSMEQAAANAGKAPAAPKELLPAKYGSAQTSPLKFDVKDAGPNSIDLVLE